MLKNPFFYITFLTLLLIVIFSACYEPTEGCLDINATNFQVDADDPCSGCCTFPKLTLAAEHVAELPNDTVSFRYGTRYPFGLTAGDSFIVNRARFLISGFTLISSKGDSVRVTDSIEIMPGNDEEVTIPDNFAKLDRDIFQPRTLGTLIGEGIIEKVSFTVGLEAFLLDKTVSGFPENHPLNTGDTLIFEENTGYIPMLFIISRDTTSTSDPTEIRLFEPGKVVLDLEQPFALERGFNTRVVLRIDYMNWLEGIDLENDSNETIREKIYNNLPNVFSVTEIVRG